MKKIHVIGLACLVALLATIIGYRFLIFNATGDAASFFYALGFNSVTLSIPQKTQNLHQYHDVLLDPDGFSKIGRLTLQKSWSGEIKSMSIQGAEFSGEIENGEVSGIAGWDRSSFSPASLDFPGSEISLDDVRFSFLGPQGGLDIRVDGQAIKKTEGWDFLARVKSAQSTLNFDAKIQGHINNSGLWQADMDIENAKFGMSILKATRVNGHIRLDGHYLDETHVMGEFQAGGMNILNLPWDNVSIALDGNLNSTRMVISALSVGVTGIELGLTVDRIQFPHAYSGLIHSETMGTLFNYLQARKSLFISRSSLAPLDNRKNIDIEWNGSPRLLRMTIAQDGQTALKDLLINPADAGISLDKIAEGLPFKISLEGEDGTLHGQMALSQDKKSLVTLPEGKTLQPQLRENSSLIDIFR